jgi:putative ATP-dependent endonuclease of the OLD family
MAKIHTLKISNYRAIHNFEHVFGTEDFVCLIGRGDSGKSTILEAISAVLSPSWNLTFYDTDFYNCDISCSIEVEVSLYNLPSELLTDAKFGLHLRFLNSKGEIIDDVLEEDANDSVGVLTIRLTVGKDLEPQWLVINNRKQEPKEIRANDRASLNVYFVSDVIDRHFSWNKGNPLYSLFRQDGQKSEIESTTVLIEALRKAKELIDSNSFAHFDGIVNKIKKGAAYLGVDISKTTTTIDSKDFSIKDGKISLHEEKIPFRLKGKGSKRLISIAIQIELAKAGGIILIDEIEQGLEPDRAQHLARTLLKNNTGQVFITTHSRDVLVELHAKNLYRLEAKNRKLNSFNSSLQGCLRSNPEAFFSKGVIVCEGLTEIGICRSIDNYRIKKGKNSSSYFGIRFANGNGSNTFKYAKGFDKAGYDVCVFCDSDDIDVNEQKKELEDLLIDIFDWDTGDSIEAAIFNNLQPEVILKAIDLAAELKYADDSSRAFSEIKDDIYKSIKSKYNNQSIPIPLTTENCTVEIRKAVGIVAKTNGWFKTIQKGQALGNLIFIDNEASLNDQSALSKQLIKISNWIDDV